MGSLSSENITTGRIFFPLDGTLRDIPFNLGPNEGRIFDVPAKAILRESDLNRKVNTTATAVEADLPTVAYGHHRCVDSPSEHSDAFRIIPVKDLGTEYWAVTYQTEGISQMSVTATEDDTTVAVILGSHSIRISVILNKFETYYAGGHYDISGMHVSSDKPVCALAGNSLDRTVIDNSHKDPYYECLVPVSRWGTRYSVVAFPSAGDASFIRVLMPFTDTMVRYQTNPGSVLHSTYSNSDNVLHVIQMSHLTTHSLDFSSTKPIFLAHFTIPIPLPTFDGMLSMVYVPSAVSATSSKFTFPIFRLPHHYMAYVNVWIPVGFSASDLFVNNATSMEWTAVAIDGEHFQIVQLSNLTAGFYVIESGGAFNFTGIVYVSSYRQYYSFPLS